MESLSEKLESYANALNTDLVAIIDWDDISEFAAKAKTPGEATLVQLWVMKKVSDDIKRIIQEDVNQVTDSIKEDFDATE